MRGGVEVSGGCGVEWYLDLWADFMAQYEDDFGVHLKIIALRCVPLFSKLSRFDWIFGQTSP